MSLPPSSQYPLTLSVALLTGTIWLYAILDAWTDLIRAWAVCSIDLKHVILWSLNEA